MPSASCCDPRDLGFQGSGFNQHSSGFKIQDPTRPPMTLQQGYAWGPMVILGGGAFSYERGTPVGRLLSPFAHNVLSALTFR